jgi:ABC-type uncharacterized transport system permease subunit
MKSSIAKFIGKAIGEIIYALLLSICITIMLNSADIKITLTQIFVVLISAKPVIAYLK